MKLFSGVQFRGSRTAKRGISQKPAPRYYNSPSGSRPASPFKRKIARKKPKKPILNRLRNFTLMIIFAGGFIYSLIIQPMPIVSVSDTAYHGAETYRSAAEGMLKNLRNRTKLTLDKKGIIDNLQREFPEIDSVKLHLPLVSQKLKVSLTVAAPSFFLTSGNEKLVLASNGVVVSAASQLPAIAGLPTLVDQSGISASPGKRVIGSQSIAFINSLLAQCKHAGFKVSSVTLPQNPMAIELRAEGSAYYVKFDLGGDPIVQAGQYLAAKHKFDSEGGQPAEYLDVRVAGKIYYK